MADGVPSALWSARSGSVTRGIRRVRSHACNTRTPANHRGQVIPCPRRCRGYYRVVGVSRSPRGAGRVGQYGAFVYDARDQESPSRTRTHVARTHAPSGSESAVVGRIPPWVKRMTTSSVRVLTSNGVPMT